MATRSRFCWASEFFVEFMCLGLASLCGPDHEGLTGNSGVDNKFVSGILKDEI